MNDLISNVLARSLGSLPTIQPRLPSMFEPYRRMAGSLTSHAEARIETVSEVEQVAAPTLPGAPPLMPLMHEPPPSFQRLVPATERRTTVHDSVPPASPDSPTPEQYNWEESHQPSQEYSAKLRMPLKETAGEVPEPVQPIHRERRNEEMVQVVQTKRYLAIEEDESTQSHITARVAEHAAPNPSPLRCERIAVPPGHPRASVEGLNHAARIRDNPSEPAIQVTIGKVEVRAIFPEPSPPAPRPPSRPTLSLDNYLQKRSRSRP